MATAKLTKSENALMFTDDFGNSYITSTAYIAALISKRMKAPFIQLNRLPMPQEEGRFKKSPVLGKGWEAIEPEDDRWTPPQCSHNVVVTSNSEAGMSKQSIKKREEKEAFKDIVEW